MTTAKEIRHAARLHGLADKPVCVHASFKSFGHVDGGPAVIVDILLNLGCTVMTPAFSYHYDQCERPWMPESTDISRMGAIAKNVLCRPGRKRSHHPLNSLAAIGPLADALTRDCNVREPHKPLERLAAAGGAFLLMGVGLNRLTYVHSVEKAAGRPLFERRYLDANGEKQTCLVGGCSKGFGHLEPVLNGVMATSQCGPSTWHSLPGRESYHRMLGALIARPEITQCSPDCAQCTTVIHNGR